VGGRRRGRGRGGAVGGEMRLGLGLGLGLGSRQQRKAVFRNQGVGKESALRATEMRSSSHLHGRWRF